MSQLGLFDARNVAATIEVPPAPVLVPHVHWPFPGLTPEESARAAVVSSEAYKDMLSAVIKSQGGAELTGQQVLALVPSEWRQLCGRFAYVSLGMRCGEKRGILVKYVAHDDGGFHFTYQAVEFISKGTP